VKSTRPAFDNLFENRGSQRNLSILDRVKDRAQTLSGKISSSDKTKLDEYSHQRARSGEARGRHAQSERQGDDQAKLANRPAFTMPRPADGLPEDLREHARLMCDIIAIAFQTGPDSRRLAPSGARPFGALLSLPRCQGRPSCRLPQ